MPLTLGDISVDTNLYYPLGTYLSDSTYCGEQFLEDASPFYSFDENQVKLFSYDSFGRLVKINNTPFASYDSFGRPASYNGNILSWYGGNLKSFGNINLYYDLSGRRIKKVIKSLTSSMTSREDCCAKSSRAPTSRILHICTTLRARWALCCLTPFMTWDKGI